MIWKIDLRLNQPENFQDIIYHDQYFGGTFIIINSFILSFYMLVAMIVII